MLFGVATAGVDTVVTDPPPVVFSTVVVWLVLYVEVVTEDAENPFAALGDGEVTGVTVAGTYWYDVGFPGLAEAGGGVVSDNGLLAFSAAFAAADSAAAIALFDCCLT